MTRAACALLLAAAAAAPGCIAVAAGAAAGFVVARETTAEGESAIVDRDVERAWPAVQDAMRALSTALVEVSEPPRRVRGEIEGADVTVDVRAYDLERTEIVVRAEKALLSRPAVARRALDEILRRIER